MAIAAPPRQIRSIPGYSYRRSYSIPIANASPVAANYVLATFEVGPFFQAYLRRLSIWNIGAATAAQRTAFALYFTTAASTAGTAVTPAALDPSNDNAYTGIARTGNPTVTLAGSPFYQFAVYTPAALGAFTPIVLNFETEILKAPQLRSAGEPNIATGNVGIAFVCVTGGTGFANFDASLDITEDAR